jgi:uncharacterized protein YrzB (UPF0473 family)
MVITILAEPRSGSTNLTNWFYFNKNFTTLFEPLNPYSNGFQKNKEPKDYKYKTKHLCLKEVYYPHKDWDSLLSISDKVIVLYRENGQEQLESFLSALTTNNWDKQYVYIIKNNTFIDEKTEYFKTLKSEFKMKYVNSDYFTISYEELYYNNGFQKILNYLNIDELENKNFPYGSKYRVNLNKPRSLI